MKKNILFLSLLLTLLVGMNGVCFAQTGRPVLLTTVDLGLTLDTTVNTGTTSTTPFTTPVRATGIVFEWIELKISGTVAGTVALQGSLDGTNWVTIGSATTATDASTNYRLATTERWYKYRILRTGAGTMSASGKCYWWFYQ